MTSPIASSGVLRIYEQVVQMQHAQGRLIDQQSSLLENQDVSITELITEVENLVNAVRGSIDGNSPSIRESIRAIERHLLKVEEDTNKGLSETREGLETLRILVTKLEKEASEHDARIQSLEKCSESVTQKAAATRNIALTTAVSILLIIIGASLTKACDAWVTLN